MPGTPETIIAFDFGLRRIGVAVGQQVTNSANPLGAIGNGEDGPDWARIASLIREWQPARLIVGMPAHADGSPSGLGKFATAFMHDLARFDLPVDAVDERYSSVEAEALLKSRREQGLRGRISKADIDAAAATLIAERWLKKEHQ
jgi:putative Holliday junction resolvase